VGVISCRISVCYLPLPLVPSRRGRGKFTFYETILFAPGDESPGYCHRCPLTGHQNRFKLALMPLTPLCHVWVKVSLGGEGKGEREMI
jgi:hypothetical protein